MNDTVKEIKKTGLKATAPRLKILEIFQTAKQRHMSAEDVYRTLVNQGNDVGLATVYRALSQFEEAGLLTRTSFVSDKAMYELNDGSHHDHLICTTCGRVEEFYEPEIEKMQKAIATDKGYTLQHHSMNLYAQCSNPECCGGTDGGTKKGGKNSEA